MVNEILTGRRLGATAARTSGDADRDQASGLARPAGSGAQARPRTRPARRDRLLGRFAGAAPVRRRARRSARATRGSATRLRSAKLLDGAYRFVCEGRICDRSRDGLRLALARDIALPPQLAVHIDETSEVREAKVVWRRGSTIGIRLDAAAPAGALQALRSVRAQGTLLRDSGLSPFRHSSSPRPEPSWRAC